MYLLNSYNFFVFPVITEVVTMVTSMFEKTKGDFGSIFFCILFTSVANIYTQRRDKSRLLNNNKVKLNKEENMYRFQTQYLPTKIYILPIKAYQKNHAYNL